LEFSADQETALLMFQMYATGNHSDLSIAEALNDRGLTILDPKTKQRRPFQKDTVRSILVNPAYIGVVRCSGKEYQGNHPPLVDRDLWDVCQAIRARRAARTGGKWATRGCGGLLSEFAFCGKCGGLLHWHRGG